MCSDHAIRGKVHWYKSFAHDKDVYESVLAYQVGDVGGRIWAGRKEEREEAKEEMIQSLKQLEETLGVRNFFGGESFGFVDIALIPFYGWFYTYEELCNFKVEAHCLGSWMFSEAECFQISCF